MLVGTVWLLLNYGSVRLYSALRTRIRDYRNPRANVGTRDGVPCLVLPESASGEERIFQRNYACAGRNGCGAMCTTRLVQLVFQQNPLEVVVWRSVPASSNALAGDLLSGSLLHEAQVHCPSKPSAFKALSQRQMSRECKKDVIKASRDGLTTVSWLLQQRSRSFVSKLALSSGIKLSARCVDIANLTDTSVNPLKRKVQSFMHRLRMKTRPDQKDATSVDSFMSACKNVPNLHVFHQAGTLVQADIVIASSTSLLINAFHAGHVCIS